MAENGRKAAIYHSLSFPNSLYNWQNLNFCLKWTWGTCLDERFDGGKRLVDDEVVGNEGPDIHDDIVAYDDDRSCADYRLVLHDELHV